MKREDTMPSMKPSALSLSLTLAKPLLLYSSLTWERILVEALVGVYRSFLHIFPCGHQSYSHTSDFLPKSCVFCILYRPLQG